MIKKQSHACFVYKYPLATVNGKPLFKIEESVQSTSANNKVKPLT